MRIERIGFTNFRNFDRVEVPFGDRSTLVVGANAQGKTNLLEGIHILCVGRSHRDRRDQNLVRFGETFYRVEGVFQHIGVRTTVEVAFGQENGEDRKHIKINSKEARPASLIGLAPVVISSPDDIDLIKRSPHYRRTFLDMALSQVSKEYLTNLQRYNRALAHRNVLLKRAAEGGRAGADTGVWDQALADLGTAIVEARLAFLADVRPTVEANFGVMSGKATRIDLGYEPRGYALEGGGRPAEPRAASVAEGLRAALAATRQMELVRGFTLVGPHVDDFGFACDGRDIRVFGSEGEQRTAVLALRCAEVTVMRETIGYHPVVLLDDVFAELDEGRSRALTALISGFDQIVLTSSRPGPVADGEINRITVAEGRLDYGTRGAAPGGERGERG
ncbi:MAG: DNA replication and repair protein RecF [bacterium]